MIVIDTQSLFQELSDRVQYTSLRVQSIFPNIPTKAIQYELLQQGLLETGALPLQLDVWDIVKRQLDDLKSMWDGPNTQVAILPMRKGFMKNGVAYKHGICLFISNHVSVKELHALITHEYHHICRQQYHSEVPTLLDSVMMEGLAEHAVESLLGEHAISSWTRRYSLEEVKHYWHTHFIDALPLRGLHNHQSYLFGDASGQLPAHIGYCVGYRIVEAFLEKHGPLTTQHLLQMPSEQIALLADFPLTE